MITYEHTQGTEYWIYIILHVKLKQWPKLSKLIWWFPSFAAHQFHKLILWGFTGEMRLLQQQQFWCKSTHKFVCIRNFHRWHWSQHMYILASASDNIRSCMWRNADELRTNELLGFHLYDFISRKAKLNAGYKYKILKKHVNRSSYHSEEIIDLSKNSENMYTKHSKRITWFWSVCLVYFHYFA